MLSINNFSLQYGSKHIFRNVSAQVHSGERIGLIGVNGAGKSTLLKIMSGDLETDGGVVSRASWFTVAYLPQEITMDLTDSTLYEEAESAFDDIIACQQEMEEIGNQLANLGQDDAAVYGLLERQGELQHLLEGRDVFRMRPEIEKILAGLGFSSDDLHSPVSSFSGGWLMRLLLAKLLLQKPALLLLDEPTNHLDIDSLTWLEEFLGQYRGSMIIISHDRCFLDRVTNITWELSLGRLTIYKGNYSFYLQEKELRLELERAAYDNQRAMIKQTERFITRFRAKSTKARQVQSRVKQLEKLERIELSETERSVRFSFPPAAPSGRDMFTMKNIRKSFADKQVFAGINLNLQRGDKLAVVGVNGAGKSTLLKIMAGQEKADGELKKGHNVILTYFGQHQAQELAGNFTVLDTVYHAARGMTITQVRSLLGAFLFSGDEVEKKVQVLSGGEKSRIALAKMLVRPANLMLLDEPTNHLDISSQEVLQEAMAQYEGTIIVVSHNRFFVNSFVNKVLEIKDGKGSLYEGNIDDYLACREQVIISSSGKKKPAAEDAKKSTDKKALRKARALSRQQMNKEIGPWKNKSLQEEEKIEQLEQRKTELEQLMADPGLYEDRNLWFAASEEYGKVERHLERAYKKWEEAQGKLEEFEKSLNNR